MTARPELLTQLPTASASTIKREGWKGVMRALRDTGRLVVTNHSEPEAVILSTDEYLDLVQSARLVADSTTDPLQALRERFN